MHQSHAADLIAAIRDARQGYTVYDCRTPGRPRELTVADLREQLAAELAGVDRE